MRTLIVLALAAIVADARADTNSQQAQANQAAAAAAAAEHQRRAREDAQRAWQLGLDPTRIRTIGLWPGKPVPCKLPKRDSPYTCRRILDGPAIILSRMPTLEFLAGRGDQAVARGERAWWSHLIEPPIPLAIAPGEALYVITDISGWDSDFVVTVYR